MKKKILITVVLVLVLVCSFAFVACDKDEVKVLSDEEMSAAIDGFVANCNSFTIISKDSATMNNSMVGNMGMELTETTKVQGNKIYYKYDVRNHVSGLPSVTVFEVYAEFSKRTDEETGATLIDIDVCFMENIDPDAGPGFDGSWGKVTYTADSAKLQRAFSVGFGAMNGKSGKHVFSSIINSVLFSGEDVNISASEIMSHLENEGYTKNRNKFELAVDENDDFFDMSEMIGLLPFVPGSAEMSISGDAKMSLTVNEHTLNLNMDSDVVVQFSVPTGSSETRMKTVRNSTISDFGSTTVTFPEEVTAVPNLQYIAEFPMRVAVWKGMIQNA